MCGAARKVTKKRTTMRMKRRRSVGRLRGGRGVRWLRRVGKVHLRLRDSSEAG
jgi:hypothetical protein